MAQFYGAHRVFREHATKSKVLPIAGLDAAIGEKGLPSNLDAERFVLGSIVLDGSRFPDAVDLVPDDFSVENHRRIFRRIQGLHDRGEAIDQATLANELAVHGELDTVGGLSYLISLDEGLPKIIHLDAYARIVKEKSDLRRTIFAAQRLMHACLIEEAGAAELLERHRAEVQEIGLARNATGPRCRSIEEIPAISDCAVSCVEFIDDPELPKGAVVGYSGDSGSGKSTHVIARARDANSRGVPVLVLDRENPASVVADRLMRLGITEGPNFHIWGGWLDEAPQPGSPIVIQWVQKQEPKPLVIVDSLSAFHGGDQNDAGEMRIFMNQLRKLADLGATVLVIHHDGKADTARDYRGSSDWKAALDVGFHVSNSSEDGRLDVLRLRCYKSRFGFSGELVYRYAGGKFLRDNDGHAASRTAAEQLTSLLRTNPGVGQADFEALAAKSGLGRNRARTFLNDGLRAGTVRIEPGARNAKRYFLV
jgi:hypothetical protein